ncbi:GNAT family N-acetyltransferase [Chryseobacterium taklimakanense]|uniref:GNAT family N-acetyltransferase n=1 Tax=Chryseobacterium taklimakanense TaxID=536441 RepID=A0A3G8WX20_9FLAO|nr:GNAT family N-acetyltransferase [Chryseobacterium taklimakanense]AZI20881.1 GNAT family N-acetyltransferase [Chryseobacterium taklimakanense]
MKFIQAKTDDITLIQQLARTSWESAYAEILPKEQIDYMLAEMYSTAEISSQLTNPNYHYFLIENNEKPVGFIGFQHHYEPGTTKLHRVYLIPEAKGLGFGKAAINFLKEKTGETGNKRIILNVNKNNSARKIYESQGFKVYEEGVFDIGGGYVMDDYLMEFVL